jgi:hypothetical protein
VKAGINPLLVRYSGKPAILDANMLLLYWCSSFDPNLVGVFKRLNCFSEDDVELLRQTIKCFTVLHTTPHVLTEVSNLANALPKWQKEDWARHFAQQIKVVQEEWMPAQIIANEPVFELGLTDTCLYKLASTHVILTIDFPLSNRLETHGLNVINFNHLRGMQYL